MFNRQPSIHFFSLIVLSSVLWSGGLLAQTDSSVIESDVGVSISEDAKEMGLKVTSLKSIDRKMSQVMKKGGAIGCNALIIHDDKEVYYGAWGHRDLEKEQPLNRDTIFRIYSMSKPVTSIAVMQLVEQGKLKLDEPVSTYLPEFANLKVLEDGKEVEPKRSMTTRDLLRHTSGLTYGFFGDTEIDKRYRGVGILVVEPNIKTTVQKLGKIPLLNHPGTKFLYSASTDVLGRLVEVASGESFDEYLHKHIFSPRKMSDTFFNIPDDKQNRFAQLYRPAAKGKLVPAKAYRSVRYISKFNEFYSGGGGLCSTIDDYAKFCHMLLHEGDFHGTQIVKPETLKQMYTNQLVDIEQPSGDFKFGLGFRIGNRGDYSWGGAAGTRFWVNPEKKLAVLYMVQIMPYRGKKYGDWVLDAAYSALR